eukprot:687643-Rhodomonas_salina.2
MSTVDVVDVHDIEPQCIEGGSRTLNQSGTLLLCIPDFDGIDHEIEITDCLIDPRATVNLIAAKQLTNTGYAVLLFPKEDKSGLIAPQLFWTNGEPLCLLIVQHNNVFLLTLMECDAP